MKRIRYVCKRIDRVHNFSKNLSPQRFFLSTAIIKILVDYFFNRRKKIPLRLSFYDLEPIPAVGMNSLNYLCLSNELQTPLISKQIGHKDEMSL